MPTQYKSTAEVNVDTNAPLWVSSLKRKFEETINDAVAKLSPNFRPEQVQVETYVNDSKMGPEGDDILIDVTISSDIDMAQLLACIRDDLASQEASECTDVLKVAIVVKSNIGIS